MKQILKTKLKAVALLVASGALFLSAPASPVSGTDYVHRLESLRGTSYSMATCSGFICLAKHHAPCSAREIWDGCHGDLVVIQEAESLSAVSIESLRAGDVLDFHGIHVAAYIGHGEIMDSVPERGVGTVSQSETRDTWYSGKVRILRWRQS